MDFLCEHNYFETNNVILKKNVFQCHICSVIFKHHGSLYKHLKGVHKVTNFGANNIKCREKQCNERFNRLAELETHLSEKHLKKIEKQKLSFGSLDEFKTWKRELEKETKSEYVTYTPGSERAVLYFKCSRSGVHKEQLTYGTRRRRLKAQGSKKSGAHCISRMIVRINDSNGAISVNFCKTHYGHNVELAQVGLCPEFLIKGSVCKHVHAVALHGKANTIWIPADPRKPQFQDTSLDISQDTNEIDILAQDVTISLSDNFEKEKKQILSLLQSLTVKVKNAESIEKLNIVNKYLRCAESLINLDQSCLPKETRQCQGLQEHPRTKIELQEKNSYCNTKKRKLDITNSVNQIKKPCYFEKRELIESLLEN